MIKDLIFTLAHMSNQLTNIGGGSYGHLDLRKLGTAQKILLGLVEFEEKGCCIGGKGLRLIVGSGMGN